MDILDQTQQKMKAVIEHLKNELKTIRTGRANTAMLDGVSVEVYGSMMRLRDIASVTTPEARQLLVTPFDRGNAPIIGKAIERANLGFQPHVEGHVVRITIPPMDQNMRKEMIRVMHAKQEEAKVGIRHVRRDMNELVRKQKADGEIAEDLMKNLEKKVQDFTDRFCKEVDDLGAAKEKEISTI